MGKGWVKSASAALLLVCLPLSASTVIRFGIVPQQSATRVAEHWIPVSNFLSRQTGFDIRFATKPSISQFEQELAQGRYDLAYMNPYQYIQGHDQQGYEAIAKARDKQIRGIVVSRKGSGLDSLSDISGQRLAFPSPVAFAASILSQGYLKRHQVDYTPIYVRSHDSVYHNVAKGVFIAGGGVMRTFNAMDKSITDQLTVVWESDGYTPHAIAVHPSISQEKALSIQQAFLALEEHAPELLIPLRLKGFTVAHNDEWDDVRLLMADYEPESQ
ncbi:phosphate/phosphite/phosphonate ABC transporter substrate-binding protein [Vibrio sp. WXL210]|uniref:phosphate/phosphite/phosphonate ABC transporter substrate-binding protein n=1 Tax=Vibrio sp. WXL210 TaxID=3450709 RepID=UPI003EC88E4A